MREEDWSSNSDREEPSCRPALPTAVKPLPALDLALLSLLEMEALTPDLGRPAGKELRSGEDKKFAACGLTTWKTL